jgi:hypothetical protein
MVQRYAHLSPDHLRKAVERLAPLSRSVSNYGTHLGLLETVTKETLCDRI